MSQVVNTNISSANAQRYLGMNQHSLTSAMQRLSSGLRINSDSDDAAGLAISERFTTQIRGNDQAVRNANDGISITQTAEGDLQSIGKNLQRMRELAVQSANASNTDSDRKAIDGELQSLSQEIDRVAKNSSFNGTNLLDGSFTAKNFQVGSNTSVNDTIQVSSITSARTSNLGSAGTSFSAALNGTATTGALTVGALTLNGQAVGASSVAAGAGQSASSAYSIAAAINGVSSLSGVNAVANVNTVTGGAPATPGAIAANSTFTVNGVTVGAIANGVTAAGQGANLAFAINQITTQTGVSALADSSTGALTLTASDGRDINIGMVGTAATTAAAVTNKTALMAATGLGTGVLGQQAVAVVAGASKAAGAFNAPGAVLGTSIAAGTLTAAGVAVGAVTLATAAFAAGTTATANTFNTSTLTVGTLTAGSTYDLAFTNNATAGTISFVATGNATTDATAILNQYNASAGTSKLTQTAGALAITVANGTFGVTAVRTAAQVAAGLTAAQAAVTDTTAQATANAAGFVLSGAGIGALGTQNHGGVAYNGQQIANAIQTALTTAGSTSTVSANTTTGVITSVGASGITFGMGGTATSQAAAVTNQTTLIAQTGLLAADLGLQAISANNTANSGTVSLSSTSASGIVYGGSNAALAGFSASGGTVASSATSAVNSIASINVLTATNATNAINSIDGALATINSARASMGAYQNRFASIVDGLQVTTENLTASRSRITDADFAKESANLSRAQVLQQAGTAMLAQANQSAQGVLALLR